MVMTERWNILNRVCSIKDFENMWGYIDSYYQSMFHDVMSDEERISEYKYIVQQLNKYISKRKEELIKLDSFDDMIGKLTVWLGEAEQYGKNRTEVVYNFIRNGWLREVITNLTVEMKMNEAADDGYDVESEVE